MEGDIKILEEFIKDYEATTDPLEQSAYFEEVPAKAIKNLINKYKEQEKIIELMAKEYVCKGNKNKYCRVIETKEYGSCKECVIESFRKKARGSNANNNSR